jgi:hypothetical protein
MFKLTPPCAIWIVTYLEWLNKLELVAKFERKDSLLDAFLAKTTPQPKALHAYESVKYIPPVG